MAPEIEDPETRNPETGNPEPTPDGGTLHSPLTDDVLLAVARRFRALSSPSRLRILNALMGGPRTMGALGGMTGLEQSNLSRQVAELEQEGCVARTREGRKVRVAISDPTLYALCDLVCGALREQAAADHARFG